MLARRQCLVAPLIMATSSALSHCVGAELVSFAQCPQQWTLRRAPCTGFYSASCAREARFERNWPTCAAEGTSRKKKMRVDELLIEQGLAVDKKQASALVMTRSVIAGENTVIKSAAEKVLCTTEFRLRGQKAHPWVSRGGVKLAHAVEHFGVDLEGAIAIDVGCSHGGFTDVLLHNGASKVYAVDVGYGQLDLQLRKNPSVVVLERTNARHLTAELVPDSPSVVVCDASFIPLSKVLPAALELCKAPARLLALIKPQFEATKEEVEAGKGGALLCCLCRSSSAAAPEQDPSAMLELTAGRAGAVITDEAVRERTCAQVQSWLSAQGWLPLGVTPSPIKGPSGNQEFIVHAVLEEAPVSPDALSSASP